MPKIRCKCDNIISLSDIPSPNQYLMISDVKFDDFHGLVDAEQIYSSMTIVVHCKVCSRLYIYNNGFSFEPTVYLREE